MHPYTFSCLILGDHPLDCFDIIVDEAVTKISDIKPIIVQMRNDILGHVPPSSIHFWRVDILLSEEDKRFKLLKSVSDEFRKVRNTFFETELEGKKPNGNKKICGYFSMNSLPNVPEDHDGYINFVVDRPENVMPPPVFSPGAYSAVSLSPFGRSRSGSAASLEERSDNIKRLKRDEELKSSITLGLSIAGASDWAQPSNFFDRDKVPKILVGRPFQAKGPPISLFNDAFSQFLEDLHNENLDMTNCQFEYVKNLYSWTQKLVQYTVDHYDSEGDRMSIMKGHLGLVLGRISKEFINDNSIGAADGTISFGRGEMVAWPALFEGKNECGSTKADPSLQGAAYYLKYWCQRESDIIRKNCCCPTFIITISGTSICVLGGVFTTIPMIKMLADMNLMSVELSVKEHMQRTTRFFVALSRGIGHLNAFYSKLINQLYADNSNPTSNQRHFPYIRQFKTQDGNVIKFNYIYQLLNDKSRAIWKAETEDGTPIVVKFVRQYNKVAHDICATAKFAPKLLYVSDDEEEKSLGGYKAVIMNYVEGIPLDTLFTILKLEKEFNDLESAKPSADQRKLKSISLSQKDIMNRVTMLGRAGFPGSHKDIERTFEGVKSAIDLLHSKNIVFADLRTPNILAVKDSTGWQGMLVDFDWCGNDSDDKYPLCMNMDIQWAEGVQPGATLKKAHDLHFLGVIQKIFHDLITP